MDNETKEILDRITLTLRAGKNEITFGFSELNSNPSKKSIISWLENLEILRLSISSDYHPEMNWDYESISPRPVVYKTINYSDSLPSDFENYKIRLSDWEKEESKFLEEQYDRLDFQEFYIIDKNKFFKFQQSEDVQIAENKNLEVGFNKTTIQYGNKTYKPERQILSLIRFMWDKRYIVGLNQKTGNDFAINTLCEECGIDDFDTSLESFNTAARSKKIPIRLVRDADSHRKVYLEIDDSKLKQSKTLPK